MLPTTWPDTHSDEFLCNQAVIEARRLISEGDAEAESRFKSSANTCLHNLLTKVGLPPTMQHFTEVLPPARDILLGARGYGSPAVAQLAAKGYRGAILPHNMNCQDVFNRWEILVAGLASLILNLPITLRTFINEVDIAASSL